MKEWLLVGRVEEVEKPGDYFTHKIADEPIVVTRDKNGNIQGFANVCRHRGVQVAWNSGNTKYFSCPYHGWVYDTSGKLVDAQHLEKAKKLCKKHRYSVIDRTGKSCVFEVSALKKEIDVLIKKLLPHGLASVSRTGLVAMTKGSEIYKQG